MALKKGAEICWSVSSATVDDADVNDAADVADVVDVAAAAAEVVVVLFYGGGITLESDVQKNEMTKEEQTPRSLLQTHTRTHKHSHRCTFTHSIPHAHTHTHFVIWACCSVSPTHQCVRLSHSNELAVGKRSSSGHPISSKKSALPSIFSPLSVF